MGGCPGGQGAEAPLSFPPGERKKHAEWAQKWKDHAFSSGTSGGSAGWPILAG